jgi:DNA replication and repair protein RecF
LILLDLAAISVYHAWYDEYPLFLMDDVDAELDRKRVGNLLEYLKGRTQTFVTTSREDFVRQFAAGANVHEVRGGEALAGAQPETHTASIVVGGTDGI